MTPDFGPLLDRVPGWAGRARVVRALDGGLTNRNLLVDVDGERYVLRLSGQDTHLLEIDRHTERDANRRAAELGLAPEVTAFIEPEGYLVTRFVAGRAMSASELSDPAALERVAAMLRTFHESGSLPTTFDAFVVPGLHRDAAEARGVSIPDSYWATAAIVDAIAAAFAAAPEPRRPCHNDLFNLNFLRDGEQIWLLDWEYAGMNDRYFDLGNFAINNALAAEAEETLVEAYFGAVTPSHLARLRLMKIVSDAREATWALVQVGISTIDFDYRAYADECFDRLLTNAHHRDYAAWLDAA